MRIDVVTLFPTMFEAVAEHGITSRALQQGILELDMVNPRDFKSPYFSKEDLWKRADQFREKYWPSGQIPVDVMEIVDIDYEDLEGY